MWIVYIVSGKQLLIIFEGSQRYDVGLKVFAKQNTYLIYSKVTCAGSLTFTYPNNSLQIHKFRLNDNVPVKPFNHFPIAI